MCFLTVLEAERSDIQAVARLVSGEGSLAGLLISIGLLPRLYTVFLSMCISYTRSEPILLTSFFFSVSLLRSYPMIVLF